MAKRDDDDNDDDRESVDDGTDDGRADDDEDRADDDGARGDDAREDADDREDADERALARREPGTLEVGDDVGAAASGEAQDDVEAEGQHAIHQLGAQRYVISAFIVATMLGAYVLGLTIHGVWAWASNRDFFALNLPRAAAVGDEAKMTWGTVAGAVVALAYAVKQYRDPDVREWTDDVAGELTKVKWPTKKEVTSSTIVVIAASTFAMVYLFLLDRLWGFVTGLIYGAGT
jgi:preprotein translocase subunit SecE